MTYLEKKDLRIVFMGTPDFAVESLDVLIKNNYNVVAVVTQPDKEIVKRHDSKYHPVKQYALEHNLPVLQPVKMKDPDFINKLRSYDANLFVVVAFRMLPEIIWKMPKYGTFNIHASLLPEYRGSAPINWAIINGETTTGVTSFFINEKIDEGDIINTIRYDIDKDAYVDTVYNDLMKLGGQLTLDTVEIILQTDGKYMPVSQSQFWGDVNKKAPKIFKDTCKIDWNNSADNVYDFIRGLSPMYGPWTIMDINGKQEIVKIFKVNKTNLPANEPGTVSIQGDTMYISCKDYLMKIEEIQRAGKKRMNIKNFINGLK